jgi:hypothetical protein
MLVLCCVFDTVVTVGCLWARAAITDVVTLAKVERTAIAAISLLADALTSNPLTVQNAVVTVRRMWAVAAVHTLVVTSTLPV